MSVKFSGPTLIFAAALLVDAAAASWAVAMAEEASEILPVPFTADEIRGEWRKGFWLDTVVRTADGASRASRTVVLDWSEDAAGMVEVPLDDELEPTAAPEDQERVIVGWAELESHAHFPSSSATRTRETHDTPLGELEGWAYEVDSGNGAVSWFFFADCCPGPPVLYTSTVDGTEVFRAEQVARGHR